MKNIFLLVVSTFIGIILGYIFFFGSYYITFEDRIKNTISSKEKFELINKYTKIVNHIRPEYSNYTELIYSVINKYNNSNNILMQGDSWFEQINFPTNDDAESYKNVNINNPSPEDLKSHKYIKEWSETKI